MLTVTAFLFETVGCLVTQSDAGHGAIDPGFHWASTQVARLTRPNYDDDGDNEQWATCFFVEFEGCIFLVTAKHVLTGHWPDGTHVRNHLEVPVSISVHCAVSLWPHGEVDLSTTQRFGLGELLLELDLYDQPDPLCPEGRRFLVHPSRDDVVDIAAIEIRDSEIVAELHSGSSYLSTGAFPLTEQLAARPPDAMREVFVVGHPLASKWMPNRLPIYKRASVASDLTLNDSDYLLVDGKNALRRQTVSVGVEASCSAVIMRMPQWNSRSCSTRAPTMNPGTSTRNDRQVERVADRHQTNDLVTRLRSS